MSRGYRGPASAYLVCPRLLELDPRHGVHLTYAAGPPCRRDGSEVCRRREAMLAGVGVVMVPHEHEERLEDAEGHTTVHLLIPPEGAIELAHPDLSCELCGRQLVRSDLDQLEEVDL